MTMTPTCPVCGEPIETEPRPMDTKNSLIYDCKRCGKFEIDVSVQRLESLKKASHLVSAWIRRQNRLGVKRPSVPEGVILPGEVDKQFESLRYRGFPLTVTQKLDTLLQVYADFVKDMNNIGMTISQPLKPYFVAEIAAKDMSEVHALNRLLHQLSYIDNSGGNVEVKADGWKRVEELESKDNNKSDSVFVALWFDSIAKDYRESVTKVLIDCGYEPVIVDDIEFNGFIMDKVLASIRQARFVVADYTCLPERPDGAEVKQGVRGGVYWEAGLAFGMGEQVIHTCQDCNESRNRIHFDVLQIRTIFWKPERLTDLEEELKQRVLATVGQGIYREALIP